MASLHDWQLVLTAIVRTIDERASFPYDIDLFKTLEFLTT